MRSQSRSAECFFDLIVNVQTGIFGDLLSLFDRRDAVAVQDSVDFINTSFI